MIFWLKVAKENVGLDSVVRDQFLLFFEKYGFYLVKICGARPPPPSDLRTASTLAHRVTELGPRRSSTPGVGRGEPQLELSGK